MQNWKDLYTELSEKITTNLPNVEWVDLWHNQVNFLEDEHPFPTPAVFLSFRTMQVEDAGKKVQNVRLQLDCYLFYETFADTYHGSSNQESALNFLNLINSLYTLLHGTSGENYSSMRRLAFNPVDTGNAGNLYQLSFECWLTDYAAVKEFTEGSVNGVLIEKGEAPKQEQSPNDFKTIA